jgi:hypothetical protein
VLPPAANGPAVPLHQWWVFFLDYVLAKMPLYFNTIGDKVISTPLAMRCAY